MRGEGVLEHELEYSKRRVRRKGGQIFSYHTIVHELGGRQVEELSGRVGKLSWRSLGTSNDSRYSLLEVGLHTGRKHQIRAQLAHAGHPIANDSKYGPHDSADSRAVGNAEEWMPGKGLWTRSAFERIGLHAHLLRFVHPVRGEPLEVRVPPPREWAAIFEDGVLDSTLLAPGGARI